MAKRRMFSLDVVDTDLFLEMPQSSQLLYFHLAMRADDDGFVSSPQKIQRFVGCKDDDMKVLMAKEFVIPFDNGVCVIRHWKVHNYIRSDRYNETLYAKEKSLLREDSNNVYYLSNNGIPNDNQAVDKMDTQVRLGKVRLGKDMINKENNISKDMGKPQYGDQELVKFREAIIKIYPHSLSDISDNRRLHNLRTVCNPRKNRDEWMKDKWQDNFKDFYKAYLESTKEEYMVRSVEKLKDKVKMWREYRGKL